MENVLDSGDVGLEKYVKYVKSEDLSIWANDLKFEIDKIMKGHPYGFAGERKVFEELLEDSSIGPIKNKPLLQKSYCCLY